MSYFALVLTPNSQDRLRDLFADRFAGWDWKGHHMTIHMGEPDEFEQERLLGRERTITAESIAENEKVACVRIGQGGKVSQNEIAHVTLAVNSAKGGKPVMSNYFDLNEFKKLDQPIKLTGVFKVC